MRTQHRRVLTWLLVATLVSFGFANLASLTPVSAQDPVTGAFRAAVSDSRTGAPVAGATVQFINRLTNVPIARRTNQRGEAFQGLLQPGIYLIRVNAPGYRAYEREQRLVATRTNDVVPLPVKLDPEGGALASATPTPTPARPGEPARPTPTSTPTDIAAAAPTPGNTASPTPTPGEILDAAAAELNRTDGRRGGSFDEKEVSTLPLGATTVVRTFDELALLLPGVALPPETQGEVAGPGVGSGVGSAGQFAVNGLRSRANNFTVDGSDNNDEDIGVRRQGFLSLVPQPVESIQQYNVITLLAPAQYGRNIGAQVDAISKSGGSGHHGTLYGFFNSSQLNAAGFFDNTRGNTSAPLTAPDGATRRRVLVNGVQPTVRNEAGGEDSSTLGQFGFVLGGPVARSRGEGGGTFYFVSAEGQVLNATRETNFAVPTIPERGLLGSGATGLPLPAFPTTADADAVFSLFPFPNNPGGVYGENTFTQVLPAGGRGVVLSGKLDHNFRWGQHANSVVGRFNLTDDRRFIPSTGGALFSTLRPRVRTQNFSFFWNSELGGASSGRPVFNQLRLSYGRTRLNFDEVADRTHLVGTTRSFTNPEDRRFLINAPLLFNETLPTSATTIYTGAPGLTAESLLGPVGQLNIAGFSPVGVDVFNFPQRRVNNTYQLADTVSFNAGRHNFAFGVDLRRTELNSDLPRNSRPLITFNGAPLFDFASEDLDFLGFISPVDLAAASAPSGFFQTLATTGSSIGLRYHQLDFFGQDEWRVRPNLSVSYGLRYEYNTPPGEGNDAIERTFNDPLQSVLPGLSGFIGGRTRIFNPDRDNFAPRVGIAWSPSPFGAGRQTVIRAGYGIFYDQILGAVVSQSRNVFPNFLTLNFAGGFGATGGTFDVFNPSTALIGGQRLVQPGTLNQLNPAFNTRAGLETVVNVVNLNFPGGFGFTLPARDLDMPMAHHYSLTFEQQLSPGLVVSAGYVGTLGRHLLRLATPNLGPNALLIPDLDLTTVTGGQVQLGGFALPPLGRRVPGVGSVNIYETSANSRYDAAQFQLRGRLARSLNVNLAYTYSRADDDASDVFDLAGAPALPQNSFTRAGERAPSNFDVRSRFSYSLTYTLPSMRGHGAAARALLGGLELASTGQFQTGQPYTVNTIFDVNLDGNLTDRLDSTVGLSSGGDRRRPLILNGDPADLLADPFADGGLPRNSFRADGLVLVNLAVVKNFALTERQRLTLRMEVFNLTNRANFGIPVRFLEAPGFGSSTGTVTPGRRLQFALKYSF